MFVSASFLTVAGVLAWAHWRFHHSRPVARLLRDEPASVVCKRIFLALQQLGYDQRRALDRIAESPCFYLTSYNFSFLRGVARLLQSHPYPRTHVLTSVGQARCTQPFATTEVVLILCLEDDSTLHVAGARSTATVRMSTQQGGRVLLFAHVS